MLRLSGRGRSDCHPGTVAAERPLQFDILGPLEVRNEGRLVPLGGTKQRALLALLVLRPNEVVPAERLIDELWGERPPGTAATALQVYVSHLRKALEPEGPPYRILVTRPPGYLLALGDGDRDLDRFQALVREAKDADPSRAADQLRTALALWRGPPLADLAYEPFVQAEASRLEELRVAAVEARIEADLALGRHDELVGELESLVVAHPLRERLRGQLMLALYRSGRQAEALEAYQDARRALVDELGIDPSTALQGLERQILRQDPALEPAAGAAPAGRRAAGEFVGREQELRLLLAGLEDALAGRGRLFLVCGDAGAGKTRLADEVASRAKRRGARILWGRSWEAGDAPPYWPWIQAIRTYVPNSGRAMLPELVGADSDERFHLFDATAAFLAEAAASQPLVIVLDDLHGADPESMLLLEFVAAELAVLPILVIGLSRGETDSIARIARSASARLEL
jgi:DNA-binding SARP family transcriptional activator